jgi:hypothetical protein
MADAGTRHERQENQDHHDLFPARQKEHSKRIIQPMDRASFLARPQNDSSNRESPKDLLSGEGVWKRTSPKLLLMNRLVAASPALPYCTVMVTGTAVAAL